MQLKMTSQQWIVALLLVVASISARKFMADDEVKLLYKVQKVEMCPDHPNLPHTYMNITIEMDPETETLYVSGILNATEPMEAGTKGHIVLYRCEREEDETCQKYMDIDIDDFCARLPEKNQKWTPFISSLKDLDPHCPVPAGIYELKDAPMEANDVKDKYSMVGHWQMEMAVTYKDRMFACMVADAVISLNRKEGRGG